MYDQYGQVHATLKGGENHGKRRSSDDSPEAQRREARGQGGFEARQVQSKALGLHTCCHAVMSLAAG
jgi:hypothetical protein